MKSKNNVTRMLDARGIKYAAFELPEEKLGAVETARLLRVRPEVVFKTIVVERAAGKHPVLVLVSAAHSVDLKKVAAAVGEKKVHLPTEQKAEHITGLKAGGISPLALVGRGFEVVIDSLARENAEVHISGGRRGLNIRLPVDDLARLTGALFAIVRSDAARDQVS